MAESVDLLPRRGKAGTVGMLVGRSYLLAGNTAHYDAVIRAFEAQGLSVIAAFASALDARPAIDRFMRETTGVGRIDALVSLTGFSLVGGPAYNDRDAAQAVLAALDVPYLSLQTLEFQTIEEWDADARGLNPLQATLQVALPELDGATGSLVFGGKRQVAAGEVSASHPVDDRVTMLARRVSRLVSLRRKERSERKLAIVLFNFPPNAGNTGSAAYLAVFPSLQRTLAALKEHGYTVQLPDGADDLRRMITEGNATEFGAPANVHARISADDHVRREPWLADIERTWGPAPGRQLSDGSSLFVLGAQFGNVFVGVQPAFGWEGDPMRLLFEGGFAPTHAFSAFYRWLREDYAADAVLHFGTHGALEFMPGKQAGLVGPLLAGALHRRPAECLPLRLQQLVGRHAGQAARRRDARLLPHARGGKRRLVPVARRPEGHARPLPQHCTQRQPASGRHWRLMIQRDAAALDLGTDAPAWVEAEFDGRVHAVHTRLHGTGDGADSGRPARGGRGDDGGRSPRHARRHARIRCLGGRRRARRTAARGGP